MSFKHTILNDMKSKRTQREWLEFWICFELIININANMIGFKDYSKNEINALLSEYAERYYI